MSQRKPRIQVDVDKNGDATIVDVTGAGESCQNLTAGLEKALGKVDEKSRQIMPSMYEPVEPLKLTTNAG